MELNFDKGNKNLMRWSLLGEIVSGVGGMSKFLDAGGGITPFQAQNYYLTPNCLLKNDLCCYKGWA